MGRQRRWGSVGLLGAAAALFAAGVFPVSAATAATKRPHRATSGVRQPKRGGILDVGEYSPPTSFDPVVNFGAGTAGGNELAAVYDTLLRYNPVTHRYVPELAQSLTHNTDYTVWTLKLRPNVTFSDGTPFDAAAVIANLRRDKATQTNDTAGDLGLVSDLSTPNPRTVVITLASPWTDFSYALANKSGDIAAPSYLAELAAGKTTALPIGAGPFKVTTFRPGEEIDMVANPNYWGGKPYLAGIRWTYVAGGTPTYQTFQDGETSVAVLNDANAEKQAVDAHVPNFSSPSDLAGLFLINNSPTSPFKSTLLRRALAEAIKPSIMNQRLYQGAAHTSTMLFPPGSRWHYPGERGVAYDPADAKRLVTEVKNQTGWNGTVNLVCNNSPSTANFGVAVESMLDPVGFKVNVSNQLTTSQEIEQVLVKQNYDVACWAWNVSDADPYPSLFQNLSSTSIANRTGYKNPAMDAALVAFRSATTSSAKMKAVHQLVQVWNSTVPSYNWGNIGTMIIYKPTVHGVAFTVNGMMLLGRAWLG